MLNSETFKIKNKSFNLMHHVPLTRLGVGLDHCKVGINLHFSTDRVSGQKHHIVRTGGGGTGVIVFCSLGGVTSGPLATVGLPVHLV